MGGGKIENENVSLFHLQGVFFVNILYE